MLTLNRSTTPPVQRRGSIGSSSPIKDVLKSLSDHVVTAITNDNPLNDSVASFAEMSQDEQIAYIRTRRQAKKYAYSQDDLEDVLAGDGFHKLQRQLRKKGCVTNVFIQQRVHHFVHNRKAKMEMMNESMSSLAS